MGRTHNEIRRGAGGRPRVIIDRAEAGRKGDGHFSLSARVLARRGHCALPASRHYCRRTWRNLRHGGEHADCFLANTEFTEKIT
eukprot:scaffold1712_cov82-Phaeocystis_antarctica.AAC.4